MRKAFTSFLWGNLGHCTICIRKAFLAAIGAWTMAIAVDVAWGSDVFKPTAVFALALSILWLAHIFVFTRKITVSTEGIALEPENPSRRVMFPLVVRTVAFAILLSAAPRRALADGACGADGCGACYRPLYANDGTRVCQRCHSCAGEDGKFNCGGATC